MVGGNFTLSSGTNTAPGVTIVMVPANGVNPTFVIQNGASLTMSSPSSGETAGLAIYQDPSNTAAMSICGASGGGNVVINGTVYAPASAVSFANGCNLNPTSVDPNGCFEVIGGTLNFEGGFNASLSNCSNYGVKSPGGSTTTTTIAMVE
jgi:hypothetical protein